MNRPSGLQWLALLLAVFAWPISSIALAADVQPLPNAHAHNDYEHERPLLDALDQGFSSVEADVYLVDGALLVAHEPDEVRPDRTLERLYLDPLQARARTNGGMVFSMPAEFTLLVDLKSEAESTYQALEVTLARYPQLFTSWEDDRRRSGAVTVIVSGNRPIETVARATSRQAAIDGRLDDLDRTADPELMPLVSDRWGARFTWRGIGAISAAERNELREIVARAHRRGQRVRFWGTADTREMWQELRSAGVDLINTDDLVGLADFLRSP